MRDVGLVRPAGLFRCPCLFNHLMEAVQPWHLCESRNDLHILKMPASLTPCSKFSHKGDLNAVPLWLPQIVCLVLLMETRKTNCGIFYISCCAADYQKAIKNIMMTQWPKVKKERKKRKEVRKEEWMEGMKLTSSRMLPSKFFIISIIHKCDIT